MVLSDLSETPFDVSVLSSFCGALAIKDANMPIFPRSAARLGRGRGQEHRPRTPWSEVDGGPQVLLQRLTELYWVGVERDLVDFLQTLQNWNQDQYRGVHPTPGGRGDPEEWLGFQSFVKRATWQDTVGTLVTPSWILSEMMLM